MSSTETQDNTTKKHAETHPCPEKDSNLRSQYSSVRREYRNFRAKIYGNILWIRTKAVFTAQEYVSG
jgi:hypothetical protein